MKGFDYKFTVVGKSYTNGYYERRNWLRENDIRYWDCQENQLDVFYFMTEEDRVLFAVRFG